MKNRHTFAPISITREPEFKPVNTWLFYGALLMFTVAPFAFGVWLAS